VSIPKWWIRLAVALAGVALGISAAQTGQPGARQLDPLQQAQADLARGRLDQALENCRKAIQLNPDSSLAYFLLGAIYDRQGSYDQARSALIRSLEIDPSRVAARILLGRIYLRSGKSNEAEAEFEKGIQGGDNPVKDANFGLGLVFLLKSQYKEALPYLTIAVNAQPEDLLRLFSLAQAEVQLGLPEVRAHLKTIDGLANGRADIDYRLGMLLFQHNMTAEAKTAFERAARRIEASTTSPPPEVSLPNLHLVLAKLHFANNDYWSALSELKNIPEAGLPAALENEITVLAGKCLLGAGQPAQGLAKLKLALLKDHPDASALSDLAWAALLAGDLDLARESVRMFETKWPQDPQFGPIAALVQRELLPIRTRVPLSQPWHLKGEGMVCCPCKTPCPCRSNGPPTEGHCEATGAYHIERGHYGNVRLDGLTFATVSRAMETCNAPVSVFVVPTATDEQLIALERIYQAFTPLGFVLFPALQRLPIQYSRNSLTYEVEVPGRLQIKIERQVDTAGQPRMQTAALDHFANVIEYARNVTYKSWDETGSLQWDFSGRQANYRTIDLDAADYSHGTMLMQFEDDTGSFNEKHLEIIRKQRLRVLPGNAQAAGER
jgi:Flp pilus assembly protein TadD